MTAAATTPRPPEPITSSERVELIDVLRGFAVLGILLVNFEGATGTAFPRADRIVTDILDAVVSASFYPLFSFLFGLGFAVQLLRARERGSDVTLLYLRRLLALFLIGATHAILIWNGDVLAGYAMFGLLLIPVQRVPDRWLLPIPLLMLGLGLWGNQVRDFARNATGPRTAELLDAASVSRGTRTILANGRRQLLDLRPNVTRLDRYLTVVSANWQRFADAVTNRVNRTFFLNDIPAFFLLGLVAGRRRILQEADKHRRALLVTAIVFGVIVLVSNFAIYRLKPQELAGRLAFLGQNKGSTIFYIALVASLFQVPRIARGLRIFAAPGKMGLTNYLLQSVVMTLLFEKYGFALTQPGATAWLAVDVAFFFLVQVPLSRWWMARFSFGPAEWLWRSMTYGARQPLRNRPPAVAQSDFAIAGVPAGSGLPVANGEKVLR